MYHLMSETKREYVQKDSDKGFIRDTRKVVFYSRGLTSLVLDAVTSKSGSQGLVLFYREVQLGSGV